MARVGGNDVDEWTAGTVLPNVELEGAVEGGLAALVPCDDPRVRVLGKAHPNLQSFLRRFRDAFGKKVWPSVLIVRRDAPASVFTVEALASFRDAIALSVVPHNRARELMHPRGHRILFSNAFWFYPWMLDKFYEDLIASTPAILGVHDVSAFRGQSSPEIFRMTLATSDIDEPLLAALLKRWHHCYAGRNPQWPDRALFRSLNMANQASQLPAGSDTTFYDVGRSIALWVSAFEILAHPGTGKSGLGPVYDLLEKVAWESSRSRLRRYKAYEAGKKNRPRRPLACWIYGEIYRARNDFLHGNPVSQKRLIVKQSNRSLFQYAAPLYRLALTGFLPLSWSEPIPPMGDGTELGKYVAERIEFTAYQKTIEKALRTARGKKH